MDQIKRVFLCIEIQEEAVKEILRVINQVKNKIKFIGKTTEPENLHCTLKFFGDINKETIQKIDEILKEIKQEKIKGKLGNINIFANNKTPKIIWIKLLGEIYNLQKKIDEVLKEEGEKYSSHITIARIKYIKNQKEFMKYIKHIKIKPVEFSIDKMILKSSELTPTGPKYTTVKEYYFKE